ncbi:MAG: polysaccharide pyruvyl transferase CsaB, partial [Oscillospiraceae bacterium]|nr:polysaccharide pyruvyl transferase CsaB [Oscillospiraceae bacterium]
QKAIYAHIISNCQKREGTVVCGAYGMHNSGDEAILEAIVAELRSIDADMPITILSRTPEIIGKKFGANAIHMFNIPAFLRAVSGARLYVNGGGSLIQDVTSTRSLWYYLFTIAAAKKLGCRVMMYGCGIGPVSHRMNRRLVRRVLSRNVDTVTLRETSSAAELKEYGVSGPEVILSADPVFALAEQPTDTAMKVVDSMGIKDGGKHIGLCVRRWPGYTDKAECFAKAAEYAYTQYGLTPVFIPINYPGDVQAASLAVSQIGCNAIEIQQQMSTDVTAEVIRRMSAVISVRLHGLIFAVTQSVPVVGVSYDPKVTAFLEYIGQDNFTTLENVSAQMLCDMIDKAIESDSKELRLAAQRLREIENKNTQAARSLYEEGYR